MPRVDFYLIAEQTAQARHLLACRLIEKAYSFNHSVYVLTDSAADSQLIDALLWTYREESFIPHNIVTPADKAAPPIQIGHGKQTAPENQRDILINLGETIPIFYTQFQRVIEIVLNDAQQQSKGREHFRLYREQSCQLELHDLRKTSQ